MVKFKFTAIFLCVLFLTSCGQSWVPISIDKALGEQSVSEINNNPENFKILDPEEHQYAYQKLEEIRNQLLASGKIEHKDEFAWELKIVEDDSVLNAFCLPGGYIYVYTGLIRYLDSEDALAGVIGHEMAHADLRHATKQLVKNMGLSIVIQFIFGVDNSSLLGLGANLLSLSFSRSDESEADMKSVEYLYSTKYDARGAGQFFEKLKTDQKDPGVMEFISTHPDPENRVAKINEKWKELGSIKKESNRAEYKKLVQDLN